MPPAFLGQGKDNTPFLFRWCDAHGDRLRRDCPDTSSPVTLHRHHIGANAGSKRPRQAIIDNATVRCPCGVVQKPTPDPQNHLGGACREAVSAIARPHTAGQGGPVRASRQVAHPCTEVPEDSLRGCNGDNLPIGHRPPVGIEVSPRRYALGRNSVRAARRKRASPRPRNALGGQRMFGLFVRTRSYRSSMVAMKEAS